MQVEMELTINTYGSAGPRVLFLHGGPGAAGYMAPVAERMADGFRTVEPLQRRSGGEPLTVARHVADLREVVARYSEDGPPSLAGHSWGAMLALAYAAEHPGTVRSLTLVGCGSFDRASRARMREVLDGRMTPELAAMLRHLQENSPGGSLTDEQFSEMGRLITPLYSTDILPDQSPLFGDARGSEETWADMLRQQREGVYPAVFTRISIPVLMIHGAEDPHPGRMIHDTLHPLMPQLEYIELERCGHYPWRERHARDAFYRVLRGWLEKHA